MAITVTSIQPATAAQGASVTCLVGGTGFTADCTIKLKRSILEVPGTAVQILSASLLRATFAIPIDLVSQNYNVVVTNTVPESGQLTNGFLVTRHGTRGYHPRRVVVVADEEELEGFLGLVLVGVD